MNIKCSKFSLAIFLVALDPFGSAFAQRRFLKRHAS
jgi:hypothetical protein